MSEKYYDFISVCGTERIDVSKGTFTSRGEIRHADRFLLEMVTVSEVCVGTGNKRYHDGIVLETASNPSGDLIIPGSTLKGVVSSNFLALTGSIERTSEIFGTAESGKERKGKITVGPAISRVFFSDAVARKGTKRTMREIYRSWKPTRRRKRHVKTYIGLAPKTTKYGLAESIPPQASLSTALIGINLCDDEIGGLLMSLGMSINARNETAILRIGWGKPQGMGQVRLKADESFYERSTFHSLLPDHQSLGSVSDSHCAALVESFVQKEKSRGRDVSEVWKRIFQG